MKLRDVESSIKKAMEILVGIQEDIVKYTNIRDKVLDEISRQRDWKKEVEAEKKTAESEKAKHLFVLEKTISQIDNRREQSSLSIVDYENSIESLRLTENNIEMSIADKEAKIQWLSWVEQRLESLLLLKKSAESELWKLQQKISTIEKEKEEFEKEKEEFNKWKTEKEEYIQRQLEWLEKNEKRVELKTKRLLALQDNINL